VVTASYTIANATTADEPLLACGGSVASACESSIACSIAVAAGLAVGLGVACLLCCFFAHRRRRWLKERFFPRTIILTAAAPTVPILTVVPAAGAAFRPQQCGAVAMAPTGPLTYVATYPQPAYPPMGYTPAGYPPAEYPSSANPLPTYTPAVYPPAANPPPYYV
jgi:hypothetical protein